MSAPWRRRRVLALAAAVLLVLVGCVPDPQAVQSRQLLGRLVADRTGLGQQPPDLQACDDVGAVETRLTGEPGLVDVRPAWPALHAAAEALQAVCGEASLLAVPASDAPAVTEARQQWQADIAHELDVACTSLRGAASALHQPAACA